MISGHEYHIFLKWSKLWKDTIFISLVEKNMEGKNSWIFGTIAHNTCYFIVQNISSF